jgi:hypothetical protein
LLAITLCVTAGIGVAAKTGSPHDGDPPATVTVTTTRTVTSFYRGVSAPQWAAKFGTMRHLAYERLKAERRARRTLLASPTVAEAISLAGATYGFADTLWRKARCESTLDPNAKNGSEASGLFQFLPSTWASTPFARFSVFSPYANALAAGWMHAQGRGGEWVCR